MKYAICSSCGEEIYDEKCYDFGGRERLICDTCIDHEIHKATKYMDTALYNEFLEWLDNNRAFTPDPEEVFV